MKRIFFVLFFLILFLQAPFIFNQQTIAACTCDNPGTNGDGKNGWQCTNGTRGACSHREEACVQKGDNVACENDIVCKCSADKTKVVCDSPGTREHQDFDCDRDRLCIESPNLQHEAFDQIVSGADCQLRNSAKPNGTSCSFNNECLSHYCGDKLCAAEPAPMTPQCEYFENGSFGGGKCERVYTPIGAISTDPGQFIRKIFLFLLPAAGSIALLLIMRSGYKIMTARGNPEGIQHGREQLVAAIVGLMFIIFSFVFLQVIANDLLKIPGF